VLDAPFMSLEMHRRGSGVQYSYIPKYLQLFLLIHFSSLHFYFYDFLNLILLRQERSTLDSVASYIYEWEYGTSYCSQCEEEVKALIRIICTPSSVPYKLGGRREGLTCLSGDGGSDEGTNESGRLASDGKQCEE
jgi:hypothetical protein